MVASSTPIGHLDVDANGRGVGYGSSLLSGAGCDAGTCLGPYSPGSAGGANPSCNADTRSIHQENLGFWYRFYRGVSGTFEWGAQYSHTVRSTWAGGGDQPEATENMGFTSVRYSNT